MSDFDDLDALKAEFEALAPRPNPSRKAENLHLAQKNFEQSQGHADKARHTFDRPEWGLFRGVTAMFNFLSTRAALTAGTALAAVGLVLIVPQVSKMPGDMIPQNLDDRVQSASDAVEGDDADDDADIVILAEPVIQEQPTAAAPAPKSYAPGESRRSKVAGGAVSNEYLGVVTEQGDVYAPPLAQPNTEAYPEAETNPVKITSETPVSTFSIDVDTASYGVVRSSLRAGYMPPKGAVRIEEMINYFPYEYPAPAADDAPFMPTLSLTQTPWNSETRLLHVAIQGEQPQIEDRPPLNLVFLIDTSGSMQSADKLPLLKQSLSLMLSRLGPQDEVSIVTYAGSSGQVLPPTPATQRDQILAALNVLEAGGSTAGQAGLQQAYAVAESMAEAGEVSRVILATDGDFNVGLSDPDRLKDYIADKRDSGVYLSVLGFGRGNLDDATMQALAQNGNGQAAYIDTLSEAQKVLVDQVSGALFPIANDVKIQVEFNPAQIAEYRLIGYETRMLRREDFNNDKVDAGDIGAGHSVTALYELTPVGSDVRLSDPLRYQAKTNDLVSDELGYLKLRYKMPGAAESQLIETPLPQLGETSTDMGFAMAIAGFGQLLGDDRYLGDWGYEQAIELAIKSRGPDPFGYRSEAVQIMRLAQSLDQ